MCVGVGVWDVCVGVWVCVSGGCGCMGCVCWGVFVGVCDFAGGTLWVYVGIVGYPHIESHLNACMWPKKPSEGNPKPTPPNNQYRKNRVFLWYLFFTNLPPHCSICTVRHTAHKMHCGSTPTM